MTPVATAMPIMTNGKRRPTMPMMAKGSCAKNEDVWGGVRKVNQLRRHRGVSLSLTLVPITSERSSLRTTALFYRIE